MKHIVLIILFINLTALTAQTILPHPYNLDFEIGDIGILPKGWFVPRYANQLGYTAFLTDKEAKKNRLCLELNYNGKYKEGIYGSVMQSIDATPYRGKTVRFRAAVRAEIHSPKGSAHLWIRERFLDDEQAGLFEYNPNQPIVLSEWNYYEVVGKISPEAVVINFGLLLFGSGYAWIDDASFEVLENKKNSPEPPKPLSEIELNNINQFANIYGLIRYFYPSELALKIDWDKFALFGLRKIKDIKSPDSLRKELLSLFQPIAPLLRIIPKDSLNLIRFPQFKDAIPNILLCWRHTGFPSSSNSPLINSEITNIYKPQRKNPALVQQLVEASNLRDSTIKFSVFAKGRLEKPTGKFVLMLRFEDTKNSLINAKFLEFENLLEAKWQKYELTTIVPSNANFLKAQIFLLGEGNIYCDSSQLTINNFQENFLKNADFEIDRDGLPVFGWKVAENTEQSGYFVEITSEIKLNGKKSLHIESDRETKISLPTEKDLFSTNLDNNFIAVIPAVLHTDSLGTLPHTLSNPYENELQDLEINYIDRTSRLATLVVLKNIIQHFNLFFNPAISLDSTFAVSLNEAANVRSLIQFQRVIQKFLHNIKDNQLRLWNKEIEQILAFPFQFKVIGSKYIVTAIADKKTAIDTSDEILTINSIPIKEYIDSISTYLSFINQSWKELKASVFLRYAIDLDTIRMKVRKKNGKILEETFIRNTTPSELIEIRPKPIEIIKQNTLYIDLTRINDSKLKEKLDSLPEYQNFIFDLRGVVLTSEHFLGYFIERPIHSPIWKIPIFTFPSKLKLSWQIIKSTIKPKGKFPNANLFFLVDERTVGIGETIAEIVKTNKIGMLIGTETAGSASETITVPLPCGFFLTMSIIKAFNYESKEIYSYGIQPNIPVLIRSDTLSLRKDQILHKALELFGN